MTTEYQVYSRLDNNLVEECGEKLILKTASIEDKNYKVYTALLTQQLFSQTNGQLIVGHEYLITDVLFSGMPGNENFDDFRNVGFDPDNLQFPYPSFIATGTTPTNWVNGTVATDLTASAPQATVLENTIGDIVWSYDESAIYSGTLVGAFVMNKTFSINGGTNPPNSSTGILTSFPDANSIRLEMLSGQNGDMVNAPIEIRVYN